MLLFLKSKAAAPNSQLKLFFLKSLQAIVCTDFPGGFQLGELLENCYPTKFSSLCWIGILPAQARSVPGSPGWILTVTFPGHFPIITSQIPHWSITSLQQLFSLPKSSQNVTLIKLKTAFFKKGKVMISQWEVSNLSRSVGFGMGSHSKESCSDGGGSYFLSTATFLDQLDGIMELNLCSCSSGMLSMDQLFPKSLGIGWEGP